MDTTSLLSRLQQAVPGAPYEVLESIDQPTLVVAREHLIETARVLRDHRDLQFIVLAELTAVDWWPREPRFEMVYLFAAIGVSLTGPAVPPKRVRLKVRVSGTDAVVPTLSGEWACADWLEREVWDLYGIVFDGHPDLRRLLMPDDWEGHPLRKDYPIQVNVPVATEQALQLTEEEFIANMQAARHRQPSS